MYKHLRSNPKFKDYTDSELATYVRTGKRKSISASVRERCFSLQQTKAQKGEHNEQKN